MSASTRETLLSDLTDWTIGPFHPGLPGPMVLKFALDGEIIVRVTPELGYSHRGIEKIMESKRWVELIPYADHIDPENAVFAELALCLAVEEISHLTVPLRAQNIRLVLCELTRLCAHLGFAARMARAVGAETPMHYLLRDRERVLDLLELLTGARFSIGFLRYGGVAADVTEGFIERVLEVCDLLRVRIKEINDVLTYNEAFISRTAFVGALPRDLIQRTGLTGPTARATRAPFDVRKVHPYTGYQQIDFEIPLGQGDVGTVGDAHDRFVIRLRELEQSAEILRQAVDEMPSGDFSNGRIGRDFSVPQGESYSRVESSRGLLGCHVVSDGKTQPARIHFRTPSLGVVQSISEFLVGGKIEDFPVILASLDIGVSEVDR